MRVRVHHVYRGRARSAVPTVHTEGTLASTTRCKYLRHACVPGGNGGGQLYEPPCHSAARVPVRVRVMYVMSNVF